MTGPRLRESRIFGACKQSPRAGLPQMAGSGALHCRIHSTIQEHLSILSDSPGTPPGASHMQHTSLWPLTWRRAWGSSAELIQAYPAGFRPSWDSACLTDCQVTLMWLAPDHTWNSKELGNFYKVKRFEKRQNQKVSTVLEMQA